MKLVRNFWNDETGQYLTKYTLLMAFMALVSVAMLLQAGGSTSGIWSTSNSQFAALRAAG